MTRSHDEVIKDLEARGHTVRRFVVCGCGQKFSVNTGHQLAKHRLKCAIYQKNHYYTKASVSKIADTLKGQK